MTKPRLGRDTVLALRQQLLLLRSAELRAGLADEFAPWQARLTWAERVPQALSCLRAHPEWPAVLLAAAVVLRPRRALRWGLRLWSGWRLWQQLWPLLTRTGLAPRP